MKKIIALLLLIACVGSLAACSFGGSSTKACNHADADGDCLCDLCGEATTVNALAVVSRMYSNSKPTKSVVDTVIDSGKVYKGHYEMVSGRVDGKKVTLYSFNYDNVSRVNDDTEAGIKAQTGKWIYVEGSGLCDNANAEVRVFDPNGSDPAQGSIALDLLKGNIRNYIYENHTLTAMIDAANVYNALGVDLSSAFITAEEEMPVGIDAQIVVIDDGASITSVTVSFVIPEHIVTAGEKETTEVTEAVVPEQRVTISAVYSYDLEKISID